MGDVVATECVTHSCCGRNREKDCGKSQSDDAKLATLNWIYFNHRVIPQANSARSHQGCGIGGPATAPGAGATTADGAGAAPSIGGALPSDARDRQTTRLNPRHHCPPPIPSPAPPTPPTTPTPHQTP